MSAMPDSALADTEQLIADLQRQLVESEAACDECRKGETGTAKVLQVINSLSGDLAPLFTMRLPRSRHGYKGCLDARRAVTPSVAAGESAVYGFTGYPQA